MNTEHRTTYHYPCPRCRQILKSLAAQWDPEAKQLVLTIEPHLCSQYELRIDEKDL